MSYLILSAIEVILRLGQRFSRFKLEVQLQWWGKMNPMRRAHHYRCEEKGLTLGLDDVRCFLK